MSDTSAIYRKAYRDAKRRNQGVVAGIFSCIFAVLGIFTLGFLFVPIAFICGLLGTLRGAVAFNLSGFAISVLGIILSIVGIATSPSLLVMVGGLLASTGLN